MHQKLLILPQKFIFHDRFRSSGTHQVDAEFILKDFSSIFNYFMFIQNNLKSIRTRKFVENNVKVTLLYYNKVKQI